ncbi:DUF6507 family protein [Nocardiopsis algeriensis]|uniref:DUF6507 family protein n=1 Tax=Nocardiopsis algeriensis TaxID=1478215 RepID=UPI003B43A1FC
MSTWDIQPAEVGGVLKTVAGHLGEQGSGEGLVGVMEKIQDDIETMGTYTDSPIVNMALGEFASHYFPIMKGMASLTISAVTGASQATTHYMNGNLEMAEDAQENAGVVPEPEPKRPMYGPYVPQ